MENSPVNLTYEVVKTPRGGRVIRRIFLVGCMIGGAPSRAADTYENAVKPFLESYCAVCHNGQAKAGGFDIGPLLKMPAMQAAKDKKSWRKIYEKVSTGEMPKKGSLLPTGEEIAPVLEWIEAQLKR